MHCCWKSWSRSVYSAVSVSHSWLLCLNQLKCCGYSQLQWQPKWNVSLSCAEVALSAMNWNNNMQTTVNAFCQLMRLQSDASPTKQTLYHLQLRIVCYCNRETLENNISSLCHEVRAQNLALAVFHRCVQWNVHGKIYRWVLSSGSGILWSIYHP